MPLLPFFALISVPAHQIVQADVIKVRELDELFNGSIDFSVFIVGICTLIHIQIFCQFGLLFVGIFP